MLGHTSDPLRWAGDTSAPIIGVTLAFAPIPTPSKNLHAKSCCHVRVQAPPMTLAKQKMPLRKIAPLLPKTNSLRGSENQQPTRLAARYVTALTPANIQVAVVFLSCPFWSARPNSVGQLRFAPSGSQITKSP
jgi:hypothetical protein